MAGMNRVILIGNVGQEPEITNTNNGKTIAKFSLATSDGMKDQSGNVKTEWHKVVCFGNTAEMVNKYVNKGDQLSIEGSISYGKYENKEGVTVYTTDIICNRVIFIGSKKHDNTGYTAEFQSAQRPKQFMVNGDPSQDELPF